MSCLPGLRFDASILDAHADPHGGTRLPSLRQDLLPTLAAEGPHEDSHGGEALQLSNLPEELLRQVQPESTPPDPQLLPASQLRHVRKDVCSQVISSEA